MDDLARASHALRLWRPLVLLDAQLRGQPATGDAGGHRTGARPGLVGHAAYGQPGADPRALTAADSGLTALVPGCHPGVDPPSTEAGEPPTTPEGGSMGAPLQEGGGRARARA